MEVKGNCPLSEIIAKKLFGISTVPKVEQEKMVSRACKAAEAWLPTEEHLREIITENDLYCMVKDDVAAEKLVQSLMARLSGVE